MTATLMTHLVSMRQIIFGGMNERLNSIRTDRDRKKESNRERKVAARKVTHVRATAQKHNSELCHPLLWSH